MDHDFFLLLIVHMNKCKHYITVKLFSNLCQMQSAKLNNYKILNNQKKLAL